jgi:hypothetical protein
MTDDDTTDTTETAEEPRSERDEGGPTGTGEKQDEPGQEGRGHGDKPSGFEPHE